MKYETTHTSKKNSLLLATKHLLAVLLLEQNTSPISFFFGMRANLITKHEHLVTDR